MDRWVRFSCVKPLTPLPPIVSSSDVHDCCFRSYGGLYLFGLVPSVTTYGFVFVGQWGGYGYWFSCCVYGCSSAWVYCFVAGYRPLCFTWCYCSRIWMGSWTFSCSCWCGNLVSGNYTWFCGVYGSCSVCDTVSSGDVIGRGRLLVVRAAVTALFVCC